MELSIAIYMMKSPQITFFMLVTDRDCIIADFAIKSYNKIYHRNQDFGGEDFVLYIYLNNLSEENKGYYLEKWASYPYTTLYDNTEKLNSLAEKPYPGQIVTSPEGVSRQVEGYNELYDELWTTELKKIDTPYIATVDADFEILNADFYFYLISELSKNPSLIGASTCYSATSPQPIYDSYSNRNIILQERNHTWFCIYKREAFNRCNISHYYYEEIDSSNQIVAYDSASYFQQHLRQKGFNFIHCPISYYNSYVHYGAASKNKTLNRTNINYYRNAFLLTSRGILRGKNALFSKAINKLVRTIAKPFFKNYLNRKKHERSTYITA
ncbi:hypothetical protein ACS5PU_12710 [Pedobacter sp. GSP4]|uniref:hypothetical protein n=1 Tax=Pedobacter sp. GSP4 TaxID=3453716 RepID=UPI003EE9DCDD